MIYCKHCGADLPPNKQVREITWEEFKKYLLELNLLTTKFTNSSDDFFEFGFRGAFGFMFIYDFKKMSDSTCRLYNGKEISCYEAKEFIERMVCQYKDCIIGSDNND